MPVQFPSFVTYNSVVLSKKSDQIGSSEARGPRSISTQRTKFSQQHPSYQAEMNEPQNEAGMKSQGIRQEE